MNSLWVGIDDTDSPNGGCTTWVLTELLSLARDEGVDLLGEPRLVRLNPNVPWKTRGNAALAARFGRGRGTRTRMGSVAGRPIWSFSRGGPLPTSRERDFVERAWERVRTSSRLGEPKTDPALVAVQRPLPASMYFQAVREVVPFEDTRRFLDSVGAVMFAEGDGRGIVGASAAIAWPGRRATWEMIAYRPMSREGAPRRVNAGSVRETARNHPGLFLCHDPRTRRLLVTPHTPCPILFGLRGTDPRSPVHARRAVVSEKVDRWVLFRTNQGTGDHLVPRLARELLPFGSGRVEGRVSAEPRVLRGGHARLRLTDAEGADLEAIAFEPTKTLPRVVRALVPGDRIEIWGSRDSEAVMKLEGIRVVSLVPRWTPSQPPRCPECARTTHTLGAGRGFMCPTCHRRFPPEARTRIRAPSEVRPGVYHPTPSARRHLAPLGPEP